MLVRKGKHVQFDLTDGTEVKAPRGAIFLHDEEGKKWSVCSVLFMPVRLRGTRKATPEEMDQHAASYLGKTYRGRVSTIPDLPPRSLVSWTRIGPVKEIRYVRTGNKAPGGFFHPFNERTIMFAFTRGKTPTLYRRGNAMRLELHSGCILDDRGFVRP
jgi:hypothetical protein